MRQEEVLRHKAGVDIGKLSPEVAQRARRFLEKVMKNDTVPKCELQRSARPVLRVPVC